ncbi:fructosamine kinase family protein [Amphibacillus cookii]|uniref:fructosamine kinase family protein n=1 Tax=Amphibacillus cookii TaxID=767787 RepID=UPI00195B5A53|nr:fructosamine kinase family protein [Amphibacillus cookii]MBM7540856.1 fructosamine-3-kinase [Amphibacillus cookii]
MNQQIKDIFKQFDAAMDVINIQPVTGGDINASYLVTTDKRRYFIKVNLDAADDFFAFESYGLIRLAETGTVHVPMNYYQQSSPPALILEWIETSDSDETPSLLGQQLAQLHLIKQHDYGLDRDGYIGLLNQPNQLTDDWVDYFATMRLGNQLNIGIDQGIITGQRRAKLESLITNLKNLLPERPQSSLLHGDLWGGNWLSGTNHSPYLIDPAIVQGDRHFELAFTELFGGFSSDFYAAYQQVFPLDSSYPDTKQIYQLFYLLVHLNIFGEMYGPQVDRILNKYT